MCEDMPNQIGERPTQRFDRENSIRHGFRRQIAPLVSLEAILNVVLSPEVTKLNIVVRVQQAGLSR